MERQGYITGLKLFLTLLIVVLLYSNATSQKQLLFEKYGRIKPERFQIGQPLTFKLVDNDSGWYTRYIEDLNPEASLIQLGPDWKQLSELDMIRLQRQRTWVNIGGGALQAGGISMFTGDLFFTLRGDGRFTQGGMEFGLINFAVGTGLRLALAKIKYKLSERKRLRIIDLTY